MLDTDEGLFACGLDGQQWLAVNYSSGEQLPSVYYRRKIDVETLKQSPQPPDGWRWLNEDEVIRKGDAYWHGGDWWDYEESIGAKVRDTVWPSIRRNRFEVGEKVVHVDDKESIVYVVNGTLGDGTVIVSCRNIEYAISPNKLANIEYAISPNKLAPYIEEAK